MTTAHAPQAGGFVRGWRSFRRWRRARPFWGGLLLLLSGLELFLSGNMNLGALQVHIGPTGFLSYVIPAMLVLCGLMTWATPNLRLFYGILGSLVAVYSLIGLNFGGFVLGLILGIIGGALAIAWTPIQLATPAGATLAGTAHQVALEAAAPEDPPVGGNADTKEIPRHVQNPERWWGNGETGTSETGNSETGNGETGNGATTAGPGDPEPPPYGETSGGYRTRMFAITLVPVTLAAVALMAFNHAGPAYAVPCPTASASASPPTESPSKAAPNNVAPNNVTPNNVTPNNAAPNGPAATKAPAAPNGAAQGKTQGKTEPGKTASPTPSATSTGTGNAFVDGWNNFIDGVKKLFGGDNTAPAPAPSESASPSPRPRPSPRPSTSTGGTPAKPGVPNPAGPAPSGSGKPADPPSTSTSIVPCLGPGVIRSAAVDPGQPLVAATQAVLTVGSLTMYNSTYDGVVDLPTRTGTVHSLKFSMSKAANKPFQLKVREPNGKNTVITSTELTLDGNVKFYTPKFIGKLFGLIPVTFTPDSPPPLTLPVLWFTDVTIDLAFVTCDTLTAPGMDVYQE